MEQLLVANPPMMRPVASPHNAFIHFSRWPRRRLVHPNPSTGAGSDLRRRGTFLPRECPLRGKPRFFSHFVGGKRESPSSAQIHRPPGSLHLRNLRKSPSTRERSEFSPSRAKSLGRCRQRDVPVAADGALKAGRLALAVCESCEMASDCCTTRPPRHVSPGPHHCPPSLR
jgi:hypothetical protein